MPEIDLVAGFGERLVGGDDTSADPAAVRVTLGRLRRGSVPLVAPRGGFDLLELPRPRAAAPWAYVKIAEGCDRECGFCAIPSFRGKQRSRSVASILAEVDSLEVREVVLVAQDLGSFGRDRSTGVSFEAPPGEAPIVGLVRAVAERVDRLRILYLYPTALTRPLIEAIVDSGVPYFDLSLQHASARLLTAMRRPGDGARFLERIARIRALAPGAVFRSSFIVGYPGETEQDHDELIRFLGAAELDWAGFFAYSEEPGTLAADLPDKVDPGLVADRLSECSELQERITWQHRRALVGTETDVLVDAPGVARSYREAPEIDGVVRVPHSLETGQIVNVTLTGAEGPDLEAVSAAGAVSRSAGAGVQSVCRRRLSFWRAGGRLLMAQNFGPTALATPANALTLLRLLAGPALLALVIATGPSSWTLVVLWVLLAGSDGVDGILARRQGTTRSGAFLDPLADKFLVLGALLGLVVKHEFGWLPIVLIAAREVGMSVFRSYAGRRGVSIPARWSAKVKTTLQDLAVILAFMPPIGLHHSNVAVWVLWVAVAMTLWTGLEYLADGRKVLAGSVRPAAATSTTARGASTPPSAPAA